MAVPAEHGPSVFQSRGTVAVCPPHPRLPLTPRFWSLSLSPWLCLPTLPPQRARV